MDHRQASALDDISALTEANRTRRDADTERAIVRARFEAFDELRHKPTDPWPPRPILDVDVDLDHRGIATASPGALGVETLRAAVYGHGCLYVPGLVGAADVALLRSDIDRALDGVAANANGAPVEETTPWYEPFRPGRGPSLGVGRRFMRDGGAVMTADSPRSLFDLLEVLDRLDVLDMVRSHLGERPALAANKSTLRRAFGGTGSDWHQDGAFLGRDVRTVNIWLCLSDCGVDAPGLDLVPRRFEEVLPTGTDGAVFEWAVSPRVVDDARGDVEIVRPEFRAGDALFFDQLFLHRTAEDASMPRERYAIETWFFAPSRYPSDRVPLVV